MEAWKKGDLGGLFSNVCVATAQPGRWLRTCCIASWRIIWDIYIYVYTYVYVYIYIERVVSGEALDAKTHLDGLQRRAPHRCVLKWHKVVIRCKIFKDLQGAERVVLRCAEGYWTQKASDPCSRANCCRRILRQTTSKIYRYVKISKFHKVSKGFLIEKTARERGGVLQQSLWRTWWCG